MPREDIEIVQVAENACCVSRSLCILTDKHQIVAVCICHDDIHDYS